MRSSFNPFKRLKAWHIVLAALAVFVAVMVVVALFWQKTYLTLPEPVVIPPEEDGVEQPAVAAGLDKFDILLLGLDAREDEPELGERSDTILLLTIDPEDNYASILSIPRDTRVRYKEKWHKINEVFTIDGPEGSVAAVEELLNTSIDRYAVVDFRGVIDLVDLMGGVVVDIPKDMYKPLENINLKKGPQQTLNGYDALAYMRYRDEILSDMDRSERQKEVLLQLADKLLQPVNLLKLSSIADTALTYVQTNISLQEILALAKYGRTMLNNGVENRVLPGINDLYLGGWYYVPFLEEIGLPMNEAEKEYRDWLAQHAAELAAEAAEAAEDAEAAEAGEAEGDGTGEADGAEGVAGAESVDGAGAADAGSGDATVGVADTGTGGVTVGEADAGTGDAIAGEAAHTGEADATVAAAETGDAAVNTDTEASILDK